MLSNIDLGPGCDADVPEEGQLLGKIYPHWGIIYTALVFVEPGLVS